MADLLLVFGRYVVMMCVASALKRRRLDVPLRESVTFMVWMDALMYRHYVRHLLSHPLDELIELFLPDELLW